MVNEQLIDRIYEAAALPQVWPELLEEISRAFGARGSVVFTRSAQGARFVASPALVSLIEGYIDGGWMAENVRGAPLVTHMHPGFQTDSDFFSPEQQATMPVYREFLAPIGATIAAGTAIQGVNDDALVMTIEAFPSEAAVRAALPQLDLLRPHLARAMTVSARLALQRSVAAVEGLGVVGTAAAVVGATGQLRAANSRFADRLGNLMIERRERLAFTDPSLDLRFASALAANRAGDTGARSVVVRADDGDVPCVLHILPLRGRAPDVFEADGLLLLLADGANANVPNADLLRLLFDLTPAEAKLTRRLLEGHTLVEAAVLNRVATGTARAQLKAVFAKTGFNRQTELVRVLSSYATPG